MTQESINKTRIKLLALCFGISELPRIFWDTELGYTCPRGNGDWMKEVGPINKEHREQTAQLSERSCAQRWSLTTRPVTSLFIRISKMCLNSVQEIGRDTG